MGSLQKMGEAVKELYTKWRKPLSRVIVINIKGLMERSQANAHSGWTKCIKPLLEVLLFMMRELLTLSQALKWIYRPQPCECSLWLHKIDEATFRSVIIYHEGGTIAIKPEPWVNLQAAASWTLTLVAQNGGSYLKRGLLFNMRGLIKFSHALKWIYRLQLQDCSLWLLKMKGECLKSAICLFEGTNEVKPGPQWICRPQPHECSLWLQKMEGNQLQEWYCLLWGD